MKRSPSRRAVKGKIRVVADALRQYWNPIGLDVPADEYDEYAPHVFSMLARGESDLRIATYLATVERVSMELKGAPLAALLTVVEDIRRHVIVPEES